MTEEIEKKIDMCEKYNILALTMAKAINAERIDCLIMVLTIQNDLLSDLLEEIEKSY